MCSVGVVKEGGRVRERERREGVGGWGGPF